MRSRCPPTRFGVRDTEMRVEGKVALITGAAKGIGRGCAEVLARHGARIAVSNSNDFPQLRRNDGGNANHWLEVMLVGVKSNRDSRGAALKLTSGGFVEYRQAQGGMSYMSI